MTHICVANRTIIGSDNGLSPGRRQVIIRTNAGILLIVPLRTNFSENLIGIQPFAFKKMHLKMSSAKWRPFRLGLNELRYVAWWAPLGLLNKVSISSNGLRWLGRDYSSSNDHQVDTPYHIDYIYIEKDYLADRNIQTFNLSFYN